jgi:hypothetical protein
MFVLAGSGGGHRLFEQTDGLVEVGERALSPKTQVQVTARVVEMAAAVAVVRSADRNGGEAGLDRLVQVCGPAVAVEPQPQRHAEVG